MNGAIGNVLEPVIQMRQDRLGDGKFKKGKERACAKACVNLLAGPAGDLAFYFTKK